MGGFFLYLYLTVSGFVLAGATAALFKLVTGVALKFEMADERGMQALLGVFARVIGGPFILMRNTFLGALLENRPGRWLALSSGICIVWSFFTGVVAIELIFRLTH